MFDTWPDSYDQNIAAIEAADPSHRTLAALEREVKRLNSRWRKKEKEREHEERKERKGKSVKGKGKKEKGKARKDDGKGKSQAQELEVGKADDPKKTKQVRPTVSLPSLVLPRS